jgi:hypothetical protein
MFDRRLMLPCPESKKYILGNVRALCFPSPNNSIKMIPRCPGFRGRRGSFSAFHTILILKAKLYGF